MVEVMENVLKKQKEKCHSLKWGTSVQKRLKRRFLRVISVKKHSDSAKEKLSDSHSKIKENV